MRCAALVIGALLIMPVQSLAAQPRIASMNVCTDQLLLSLADPGQIAGLSRYARDDWQSWRATEARKFPVLSGGAEDILVLKPDVVVASLFDKRSTRDLLRTNGVQLAEFSVPRTMDEVKAQILRMGEIASQPERANAEIARIDAAVRHARETLGQRNDRVLPLSRRGWVAGRDSLLGVLLREAGLRSAADELGIKDGAFISLEGILALKPDILLLSEAGNRAEDEGRAFLLHPALERFYPLDKRIVIPDRLTVCGGVMLAEALDLLVSEMKRIGR
ncbi:ABC transporter substrate-binding protein [Bradyrhizobium liaoningense]|nr:ABC transporter substrate-binding protein [Bradyrhizobium liaoningense]